MPPFTSLLLFDQFTFTKLTGHKNWKDKCRYKNEHVERRITSFPFDLKCCPFSMHINHFTVATILAAFICCSITIMTDRSVEGILWDDWENWNSPSSVNSVQLLSHVWLFVTPRTAAHQASLSITNSRSLLKFMSIEPVMPSNHLILCHPLLPPSVFPSIRVFSNESVLCIRWPKYWSFRVN